MHDHSNRWELVILRMERRRRPLSSSISLGELLDKSPLALV